jgi:hypothetical protein
MVKLLQIVCIPVAAIGVFTPQGERAADCVVLVPETAIVKTSEAGISLHHDDGSVEHVITPDHCHTDDVAVALAQRAQNQWIDEAGFTYNPGFSNMTGYNNIPDAPRMGGGQIVYYFLGLQNMEGGPVSILQPVLAYSGGEWTGASWACCPSNITTTGPSIGPAKEGDRMYGSMIRTDESTWEIVTQFNGQTSKLNAQVGPWNYNWAVATLEEYSINSCDQYPHQPVTFDTIELKDATGSIVHPQWTNPGETTCSGRTTIQDESTVTIQHGSRDSGSISV